MSTIYQLHIYQLLRNNGLTTKVFSILGNKIRNLTYENSKEDIFWMVEK